MPIDRHVADPYAVLAEFTAAFSTEGRRPMPSFPDEAVAAARRGVVVELGGGTGANTVDIADRLPESTVWSVESSATMRAVLLSRLTRRPDLLGRITVEPGDLFTASLPDDWGLAIGVHFTCQLSGPDRRALWRLLAERLAPGGVALIDRHCGPATATVVKRERVRSTRIGENVYERWFEKRPTDGGVLVRNTYRTMRDGVVLSETVSEDVVEIVAEADTATEIAAAGLVSRTDDDWLVLTGGRSARAPRRRPA